MTHQPGWNWGLIVALACCLIFWAALAIVIAGAT